MKNVLFLLFVVMVVGQSSVAPSRHENRGIKFAAQLIDPKFAQNISSVLHGVFEKRGDIFVHQLIQNFKDLQDNSEVEQAYARALNLKQAINMLLQQIGDPNPRVDFVEGQHGVELFRKQHQQLFGAVDPNTTVDLRLLQHIFN